MNVVEDGNVSAPESPYSAARSMARDLTLPSIPNLDIPNSPPGSPPPGMQKKMTHFLELKKQGIHFNEKLAQSSALKNPSLLSKLMTAVGMEGDEQYVTTLPKDLWDPSGFPSWAYKEELAKAQQEAQKKREEEAARTPRDSIDFVSASVSGQSSRSGTPGLGSSRGQKASAAERVMAGLDRDRARQLPRSELTSRATHSRKRSRSR